MYRNHPLQAKLREICYVDKWFSQTLPFPDFNCFCTSAFYCWSRQVLFLPQRPKLLKGLSPPQPHSQTQTLGDSRIHRRYPEASRTQRKDGKFEWAQNSDWGCYRFPFPKPCHQGLMHSHHWETTVTGEPLGHPEDLEHLHFREVSLHPWLGCTFWSQTLRYLRPDLLTRGHQNVA